MSVAFERPPLPTRCSGSERDLWSQSPAVPWLAALTPQLSQSLRPACSERVRVMPSSQAAGAPSPPSGGELGRCWWVVSGPMSRPAGPGGTGRQGPLQAHALRGSRQEGLGGQPHAPALPLPHGSPGLTLSLPGFFACSLMKTSGKMKYPAWRGQGLVYSRCAAGSGVAGLLLFPPQLPAPGGTSPLPSSTASSQP